jgi:hypothetical protein
MTILFVLLSLAILALVRMLHAANYVAPTRQGYGLALLIAACVVAPTVGLEASSDVWIPGTRWPMLMQFWSPFLFCVSLFAVISALPHRVRAHVWQAATACAAAFSIILGLSFNHTQVIQVRKERAFFTEFQSVVNKDRASGAKFPRRYLIQVAEPGLYLPQAGRLADAYAHTLLGRDVTFELVDAPPEHDGDSTFFIWNDEKSPNSGGQCGR